jgi:hypothetical protein
MKIMKDTFCSLHDLHRLHGKFLKQTHWP